MKKALFSTVLLAILTLASLGSAVAQKRYAVGDIYDRNGKKGVVFEVSEDGLHGKIISAEQTPTWIFMTDRDIRLMCMGADSRTDGASNTAKFKAAIGDWREKSPVLAWCDATLGEGWYIPAIDEMKSLSKVIDKVNATLKQNGYPEVYYYLFTSTEHPVYKSRLWIIDTVYGDEYRGSKGALNYARGVAQF